MLLTAALKNPMADQPVQPTSRTAWRAWLQKHHASSPGVWLVYAKKHTGLPSLTYNDAVEEALCFGWIDSLMHPVDDTFFKQLFTPRKPKSAWSAIEQDARRDADRRRPDDGGRPGDDRAGEEDRHVERVRRRRRDDAAGRLQARARRRRPPRRRAIDALHAGRDRSSSSTTVNDAKRPDDARASASRIIVHAASRGRNPFDS